MHLTYMCPVCGYTGLAEPPRSSYGGGSYEICHSCGFEFGVTDDDRGFSYEEWRRLWVLRGMPWDSARWEPAPPGWDPARQLADLDRLPHRGQKPMNDARLAYLRRVRDLVESLRGTLTDEERGRVDHLIDHDEPAEGLLSLAWILVNGNRSISRATYDELMYVCAGMVADEHLPPDLREHVDPDLA